MNNPGFEEYSTCPYNASQLGFANPWQSPAYDPIFYSSDFYHGCQGDGITDPSCTTCVPENWMGHQEAYTGEAYGGFYGFFPLAEGLNTVNEGVQTSLSEPLTTGVTYTVSFYVNLSDRSQYATDQLYAHLSVEPVNIEFEIFLEPHVVSPEGVYLTDKDDWMLISGEYVAEGGEEYITICNFENFYLETDYIPVNGGDVGGAYYYIDEVSVTPPEIDPIPEVTLSGDTILCLGDTTTLLASNANSWEWTSVFEPDVVLSEDSVLSVSPEMTTLYYFYDGNTYQTLLVEVLLPPQLDLGDDVVLCENQNILLSVETDWVSVLWNDGSENNEFLVQEEGEYTVTVSDGFCSNSDTIVVSYEQEIYFDLGLDQELCEGRMLVLTIPVDYMDYNVQWNTGSQELQLHVTEGGLYSVEVSSEACSFSDEVFIESIPCGSALEMPNIFTPNGDDFNATFRPSISDNIVEMKTLIFNRWGAQVYETDSLTIDWDGTINGNDASPGVYYYTIQYRNLLNEEKELSGYFTLLRNE